MGDVVVALLGFAFLALFVTAIFAVLDAEIDSWYRR